MPRDKTANHIKLMAAAREEFLEHGFEKASMRSIGERCGLTAAGLYRHCRDKEDLFDQLVSPAAERLGDWMRKHVARYTEGFLDGQAAMWQDSWTDMMRDVVYLHMEDYYLLAGRSQGTKYARFLHDLTEDARKLFTSCIPLLRQRGYAVREMDSRELHILLSAYLTALFEPVLHNYQQEDAYRFLDTIEAFFLPGWKQLLGV